MAEISEGFCVAACMFKTSELEKAVKDGEKNLRSLGTFMMKVKQVAQSNKIQYGSQKSAFINAYKPKDKVSLENFVQGISGALAIHEWLRVHHNESINPSKWKGYLTGAKWPSEVEKLRVDAFGMQDYNSSDFIIFTGKQSSFEYYYGISLKKKGASATGTAVADPTLINKAFDTILNKDDSNVKKVISSIKKHKEKYFSDVVREAAKSGNPLAESNFGSVASNNEKLWRENIEEPKPASKKRSIIDIKGSGKVDLTKRNLTMGDGQPISLFRGKPGTPEGKRPWPMRDFVNKRIQGYFGGKKSLEKVLQDNAETFANALINLILKEQLYKKLDENETLKNTYFGFALVTGTASINVKKNSAVIKKGTAKELHTILCGLSEMNASKKPYVIKKVANPKFKGKVPDSDDEAAKVFYDLSKNNIVILNLEIRYKGSFTPQPQFQAKLSPEFKAFLEQRTNKCLKWK
tara:strand:+ start:58 stop:1449 length:1392 start_codon:yes stop_codon:yes gene_type:complete